MEFGGEGIDFLLQITGFGKGGFDFVPEADAVDVNAFLGEIADVAVFGFDELSSVGFENPGDTLHQGGFSSSIVSGESNAFLGMHGEGEIFEDHSRAEFDMKVLNSKHRGQVSGRIPTMLNGKFTPVCGRMCVLLSGMMYLLE